MEPRQHFDGSLKALYESILKMGALVEQALNKAISALSTGDGQLAQEVIAGDATIDELHVEIEDRATRIIAMEQPVATDLRELITITKLSGALERIGDHARHIASAAETLPERLLAIAMPSIRSMAEIGSGMVHDALTAFAEQDVGQAREIAVRDDRIDAAHRKLYELIVSAMQDHPEWIANGVALLSLNRYLERLGDHVTNMCEWVVYAKTGMRVELNR